MNEVAETYTVEQRRRIVGIARWAIGEALAQRPMTDPHVEPIEQYLSERRGCFVTLRRVGTGALRGCIGSFEASEALAANVARLAVAATRDPRFRKEPVTLVEVEQLTIDVSVLTPMLRIDDPMKLRIGVDGIYLKRGELSGCFLPEVAVEQRWTIEKMLEACCDHKMHLPRDAWRTLRDMEFYVFESIKLSERSPGVVL